MLFRCYANENCTRCSLAALLLTAHEIKADFPFGQSHSCEGPALGESPILVADTYLTFV